MEMRFERRQQRNYIILIQFLGTVCILLLHLHLLVPLKVYQGPPGFSLLG
jgi:hypothetical protein